ncbi:M14 family metallopeptidase [Thalassobacillus devorans]|uniref:M14 family metallopeptidase n=1 Tax=Thalassobacillus devorans TaxID=279813 RepID=UPI0004AC5872|nr:M14 family metallocarboxypeptidase [Thalassobacillus devorans]
MSKGYDSHLLNRDVEICIKSPYVHVEVIGESLLKKPLHLLTIGKGPYLVHWNGGFHGNEWMTSRILMDIVFELLGLQDDKEPWTSNPLKDLLKQVRLQVVPMVNPDGVDLVIHGEKEAGNYCELVKELNHPNRTFSNWKANIRGVDLNKQFPSGWKIEQKRKPSSPTFRDFPGYRPLTEPESRAMAQLVRKEPADRLLCFHSQGEVIYYGYFDKQPATSNDVVKGFQQKSGYEPVRTFDSHAGLKDWFIDCFQKEGYTVEVGTGINPLPLSQYDRNLEKVRRIAFQSLIPC